LKRIASSDAMPELTAPPAPGGVFVASANKLSVIPLDFGGE
jgi:hypothetical protein